MKPGRDALESDVWWLLGAAGCGVTFVFAYRFMAYHFMNGPYLYDTGWYSYSMFRNGFTLPNLPHIRAELGDSFFTQHLYLLASLLHPLSYLVSTHYIFLSLYMGATYVPAFLGPFLAVRALPGVAQSPFVHAAVAFLIGLLFVASGPVIMALGYPHLEVPIPTCFMIFLALHLLGWHRGKWVALAVGLIVREDAGLHYFGYTVMIGLYELWRPTGTVPRRTLVQVAALSVAVSLTMMFVQRHFFPIGVSMFEKSYVGTPRFAQLDVFPQRFMDFVHGAPPIYVPALVVLAVGLALRAPALLLAYLACVPWVVLNIVFSISPAAHSLSLYYGFPLLLGLAWPLFAPHWTGQAFGPRLAVSLVAGCAVLSTALLGSAAHPFSSAAHGGRLDTASYFRVRTCLEEAFQSTPGLYADATVVAMFGDVIPADRLLVQTMPTPADAAGFVFYADGSAQHYLRAARELGLTDRENLPLSYVIAVMRDGSALKTCLAR
jgi:hypothetical protein